MPGGAPPEGISPLQPLLLSCLLVLWTQDSCSGVTCLLGAGLVPKTLGLLLHLTELVVVTASWGPHLGSCLLDRWCGVMARFWALVSVFSSEVPMGLGELDPVPQNPP